MVHSCAVPDCHNRSNRETELSYFGLPLSNKKLLRIWVHKIRRTNLPLNQNTRICSNHFVSAAKRKLRPGEYPTLNLPLPSHTKVVKPRKSPKVRAVPTETIETSDIVEVDDEPQRHEPTPMSETVLVGTDDSSFEALDKTAVKCEEENAKSKFCLDNVAAKDIPFYTGFPTFESLRACYNYLGPEVDYLMRWGSKDKDVGHGRSRSLTSFDEFFLVLVRQRMGLFEKDLAKPRFNKFIHAKVF